MRQEHRHHRPVESPKNQNMNNNPSRSLRRAGWGNRLATTITIAFFGASLTGLMTLPALGQVPYQIWTGADSPNWSDPNNWNPAGVPQNGESLYFAGGDSNDSMVNDLENLSVYTLTFSANDYQIDGNPIAIDNGIYNSGFIDEDGSETLTINCPLIFYVTFVKLSLAGFRDNHFQFLPTGQSGSNYVIQAATNL